MSKTKQKPSRNNPPEYLMLGRILRPHGVRGELKVSTLTDYPERVGELERVYIGKDVDDSHAKPYTVAKARLHQKYILLTLDDIADRDEAERFRQLYVMVSLDDAVPLESGEFYLFEVVDCRVETADGETLGIVKDVIETGANDVYIVDSPTHGDVLIPVTEETIIEHDIENGVVRINLLDGLLPEKKPKPSKKSKKRRKK